MSARLDEFSPFGRSFTYIGNFLKSTEVAQILGLLFSTQTVLYQK
jgi:hypothetical protein